MLRDGDFASRDHSAGKITKYIQTYNSTAKPLRQTYDAELLKAT
jgi:hypothetical protein